MITHRNSERGQSVVILALALVGLLGFTALAIDGGMAFNERRLAQSSADAASLAGARAASTWLESAGYVYDTNLTSCGGGTPAEIITAMSIAETAAINRAGTNNYTIDDDLSDNNGVRATYGCEDHGSYADKYIDVTTTVTREVTSAVVQLFLPGGMTNTVESVVRLRPRTAFYYGNALVGLKETCDNEPGNKGGVTFGGSNDTVITGGAVYSNACLVRNGIAPITAPSFGYRSGPPPSPDTVPPAELSTGDPMPRFDVPEPDCYGPGMVDNPARGKDTDDHDVTIYYPGRYTSTISLNGNYDIARDKGTKIRLEPGLYCLGDGIKINGGFIEGDGVTLYITGGTFETSGGAEIHLTAPTDQNQTMNSIVDLLIYMPESHVGTATLTGNAGSYYIGTVYVPSGTCNIAGTTDGIHDFNSQIVCGTVKITGNATIAVRYNKNNTLLSVPDVEQNK
jgi:hypothetical protein